MGKTVIPRRGGSACLTAIGSAPIMNPLYIRTPEGFKVFFHKWLPLMGLVFALLIAGCESGGDGETTGPVTTLDPGDLVPEVSVQIVDHQYRNASFSDENLDPDPIFQIIRSATSTLDIAVSSLDRQAVVQALLDEAATGTQIRIVTEKAFYDDQNYKAFYNQLEDITRNSGNISIRTDNEGFPRVMHSRFLVIDRARVVTGSYTWESADFDHTFGDVISLLDTGIAAAFTNQFNQMFNEGNFGVNKRDDTPHSFLVGGGRGMVEVYFGPTDKLREQLVQEVVASRNVSFAVQQFKDEILASQMLGWLSGNLNRTLTGAINDIGILGDAEENFIYQGYFFGYLQEPPQDGGALTINADFIDPDFAELNTMNHKLLLADHGETNGEPSLTFTTANYTPLSFSLNDEVMVILRGAPLVSKYWRGVVPNRSLQASSSALGILDDAADIQEFDSLAVMYPYVSTLGSAYRGYPARQSAYIFGEVENFQRTITVPDGSGAFTDIDIDLSFEVEGRSFFGEVFPSNDFDFLTFADDEFEENEILNPNHRYLLVVPAGEVTVTVNVLTGDGSQTALFEPTVRTVTVGPGGVRNLDLRINQTLAEGTI
jgi:cardiolipin hydrolase